jgi:hypothetical protein
MFRTAIHDAVARIRNDYFLLQVNQRFYVNAIAMLIIFLLSSVVLGPPNVKGVLYIFLVFWIAAICYDLISSYKVIYETVLGKGFLVLLFTLCTNFAIVLTSQLVNDIVGVDPSKFSHTVTLLSILSIPFFIVAGIGILYFVLFLVTPFLLMFHTLPDEKSKEILFPGYSTRPSILYQKTTLAVQIASFAFFFGVVLFFSQKVAHSYETFLTDAARSFLYDWEMYPKAPCVIEQGSRVAFLDDEKILLGIKSSTGITFNIRECKGGR